jgi:hypothetical protein
LVGLIPIFFAIAFASRARRKPSYDQPELSWWTKFNSLALVGLLAMSIGFFAINYTKNIGEEYPESDRNFASIIGLSRPDLQQASSWISSNTPESAVFATNDFVDAASPCSVVFDDAGDPNSLLFRVVTQQYGQGIVSGLNTRTSVPWPAQGNGGSFNDICSPTGDIYLEVDLSCPVCATCSGTTLDGYTGTTIDTLGLTDLSAVFRRYKNLEFEDQIGEVSFDLESVTVSVTERKLRAQWSPELAQDVAAFHNIDAEAELTALLSEQVAAEIDREILRDLRKGAAWNLRWDYNGWRRISQTTSYTQKDWNQTLITAINQLSAQIHKSTLRGGANWIVVSSEVSAIFDDLEYFHVSNASPEQDQYNMGIERVGTLAGRYQVYRDPYFPPNQVLIGHKGTSLLDTGYIYAPYVPLQLTPTMYNPFNFTPIKGIMTRYAKKMVNNRFYARITVDGVRTFDLRELR